MEIGKSRLRNMVPTGAGKYPRSRCSVEEEEDANGTHYFCIAQEGKTNLVRNDR